MDKVTIDKNTLIAVVEALKDFADHVPITSYKAMNSFVAIVITLEQALNSEGEMKDG